MDLISYEKNPEFNWLYFKNRICEIQNIPYLPCPIKPKEFPSIVRPLINLTGMGSEVTIVNNYEEFDKVSCFGYFSTKFIEGAHLSYDYDIIDGNFYNETIFYGYSNPEYPGTFKYWELVSYKNKSISNTPSISILKKYLKHYTGPLNFECIGNTIIEVHLRHGFYGNELNLISENQIKKPLYLIPIWGFIYDDNDDAKKEIDSCNKDKILYIHYDNNDLNFTGSHLQRKALIISTSLKLI